MQPPNRISSPQNPSGSPKGALPSGSSNNIELDRLEAKVACMIMNQAMLQRQIRQFSPQGSIKEAEELFNDVNAEQTSFNQLNAEIAVLKAKILEGTKVDGPSLEKVYVCLDVFAKSDRKSVSDIVSACPLQSRGFLAWCVLALILSLNLKDPEKNPCIQALERGRKVSDEGREPTLKALATLLFNHKDFTFVLTPYLPRLKEYLEKELFSTTVLSFTCCGLRHPNILSPAVEELIALTLKKLSEGKTEYVDRILPILLHKESLHAATALSICSVKALLELNDSMSRECGEVTLKRYFAMGLNLPKHAGWERLLCNTIIPLLRRIKQGYMAPEELEVFEHWLDRVPDLLNHLDLRNFPNYPAYWARSMPLPITDNPQDLSQQKTLVLMMFLESLRENPEAPFPLCLANMPSDWIQNTQFRALCARYLPIGDVTSNLEPEVILDRLLTDHDLLELILLYQNRQDSKFIETIRSHLFSFLKPWPWCVDTLSLNQELTSLNYRLLIALEAMIGLEKIPEKCRYAFINLIYRWLGQFKESLEDGNERSIFLSHQFLLTLARFAVRLPKLLTEKYDLTFLIQEASKAPQTSKEREAFYHAVLLLQKANPQLLLGEEWAKFKP